MSIYYALYLISTYQIKFREWIYHCSCHEKTILILVSVAHDCQEKYKCQVKNNVSHHDCQLGLLFSSLAYHFQLISLKACFRIITEKINVTLIFINSVTFHMRIFIIVFVSDHEQ